MELHLQNWAVGLSPTLDYIHLFVFKFSLWIQIDFAAANFIFQSQIMFWCGKSVDEISSKKEEEIKHNVVSSNKKLLWASDWGAHEISRIT